MTPSKTPFAGFELLGPGDSVASDGWAFQTQNPSIADFLAKIGAVLHRHDGHAAMIDPVTAPTLAVAAGGTIDAATAIYVQYTLTDPQGGESLPVAIATIDTPSGYSDPTGAPNGTLGFGAGSLLANTFLWALSVTDGLGGETALGPPLSLEVPPATHAEVVLSDFTAITTAASGGAGGAGWRLWRSVDGGNTWALMATGAAATDAFTDDGTSAGDCTVAPLTVGTTGGSNELRVTVPSAGQPVEATLFTIYGCLDAAFLTPCLLGVYPVADYDAVQTFTALTASDGQPPARSLCLPGANQIDPDTDIMNWPWKLPVVTADDLPSVGNGLGDVRLVTETMVLWGWSADDVWVPLTGPGSGGIGHISPSSIAPTTVFGEPTVHNPPVTIHTVTPSSGPIGGGTPITLIGTGFVDPATVVIGQGTGPTPDALPCTDVVVVSPTEITAVTPAEPSGITDPYHVWVTDALGHNFQLPSYIVDVWTYSNDPDIFGQDSFTDADGTDLSAHTPEIGSWTNFLEDTPGHIVINGDKARAADENYVTYYMPDVAPNLDYEVTMDTIGGVGGGTDIGIWARFDPDAWGGYLLHQQTGVLTLCVGTGGVFTTLASVAQVTDETITLRVEGDTISALVGGVTVLSATDSTYSAPGHVGVRGWYNGVDNAQGDNFDARTLVHAPFVRDTFTDPDGTLLTAHTGELGATWTLHPDGSPTSPQITSNRTDVNADGSETRAFASGVPPTADYVVTADFVCPVGAPAFGYADVWVRLSETDNAGLLLRYNSNPGGGVDPEFQFYEVVAGAFTPSTPHIVTLPASVTIRCVGTDVTVTLADGTVMFSVTDADPTAIGRVGVGVSGVGTEGEGVYVDNIVAYQVT